MATITNATDARPIVITTSAAHGFNPGQLVKVADVGGNIAANGLWVSRVLTTTTIALLTSDGAIPGDDTDNPNAAYTSATGTVVSVATPFTITNVAINADNTVTIETTAAHNLIDSDAILIEISNVKGIEGIDTQPWAYHVIDATHFTLVGFIAPYGAAYISTPGDCYKTNPTAFLDDDVLDNDLTINQITNITDTNPIIVTAPNHGLITGQIITITKAIFTPTSDDIINGIPYPVTVIDVNTFSISITSAQTVTGTACGDAPIPTVLHAAVDHYDCPLNFTLTYDPNITATFTWISNVIVCDGHDITLQLVSDGAFWYINLLSDTVQFATSGGVNPSACSPFDLTSGIFASVSGPYLGHVTV